MGRCNSFCLRKDTRVQLNNSNLIALREYVKATREKHSAFLAARRANRVGAGAGTGAGAGAGPNANAGQHDLNANAPPPNGVVGEG